MSASDLSPGSSLASAPSGEMGAQPCPQPPRFSPICCSAPGAESAVSAGAWVLARAGGEACPPPHLPRSGPVFVTDLSPGGAIRRATAPPAGHTGEGPAAPG